MSEYDHIMKGISKLDSIDQLYVYLEQYYERAQNDLVLYNDLLRVAEHYGQSGYREVQIDVITTLYEIEPSNKTAYLNAQAYSNYGEYDQAYDWILKAKQTELQYKTSLLKAQIMIKIGMINDAKEILVTLIKKFTTKPEAYMTLAELYEQNNSYELAEYYYETVFRYFLHQVDRRAIRLKLFQFELMKEVFDIEKIESLVAEDNLPLETAEEYRTLALAYQRGMQYEQAITYAKLALQTDKNLLDASFLLMELYEITGHKSNLKKELDFLTASLPELHPTILDVAVTAQKINYLNDDLIGKISQYFQMSDDEEEQLIMIEMIVNYKIANNRPQEALEELQEMSDHFSDEIYLSHLFAAVYRALGQHELVEEFYQLALDNLSTDPELVYEVVTYYEERGHLKEAFELAERYKGTIYDAKLLQDLREQLRQKLGN